MAGRGAREGSLGTNRPPLWYDPAAQLSSRTTTRSDKNAAIREVSLNNTCTGNKRDTRLIRFTHADLGGDV